MHHPFTVFSRRSRRLLLEASGIAVVLVGGAIWWETLPLQTAAAPLGILSFELAGQPFIVTSIRSTWGPVGITRAAFATGLGALLALACWAFLSVVTLIAADHIRPTNRAVSGAGTILAWVQFVAFAAAIGEEMLLMRQLTGDVSWVVPATRLCAEAKYAVWLGGGFYTAAIFYYSEGFERVRDVLILKSLPKTKNV